MDFAWIFIDLYGFMWIHMDLYSFQCVYILFYIPLGELGWLRHFEPSGPFGPRHPGPRALGLGPRPRPWAWVPSGMATDPQPSIYIYIYICFYVFMSLVWPTSVPQALFVRIIRAFPEFWTMSILEIVRTMIISVFMQFGTCLKRRAPKNDVF